VSLLTELDAFFTEHGRCGDLDAGVEGPVVWFDCECGASMARRVDEDNAQRRLAGRHVSAIEARCPTTQVERL
jgi:hypothetical protein